MNLTRIPKYKIEEFMALDPEDVEKAVVDYLAERRRYLTIQQRIYRAKNRENHNMKVRKRLSTKAAKAKLRAYRQQRMAQPEISARVNERRRNHPKRAQWNQEYKQKNKEKIIQQNKEYRRRRRQFDLCQRWLRENPNDVRVAAHKSIPNYFQAHEKVEIVNMVCAAILERKIRKDEFASGVKSCVTAYNRQFDHFKTISIDAPIAGTEGLTRADLIYNDTFHF